MDEYDIIKKSSLKFKGEKRKKKHDHASSRDKSKGKSEAGTSSNHDERPEDAESHGGWWKVEKYEEIRDDVAIEFLPGCYAKSFSNGTIALGNPHPPGEGPDEEEIFTAVCVSTNQLALKSGFGRYLGVNSRKQIMGLSEAIGEQEMFLPVFEDGKLALCAYNDCFLSPDEDDRAQPIVAKAQTAGPYEMINIRVEHDPRKYSHIANAKGESADDVAKLYETEMNYIKKFKKSGQPRTDIEFDKKQLKKAKTEGQLHETLLDKRVKQKSDKYCK